MEEALLYILKINLIASAFILIVLGISRCVGMRCSARWRYISWLVLAVIMLLPVDFSKYAAIVDVQIPAMERTVQPEDKSDKVSRPQGMEDNQNTQTEEDLKSEVSATGSPGAVKSSSSNVKAESNHVVLPVLDIPVLLVLVWILGGILVGGGQLLRYRIAYRRLCRWSVPVSNTYVSQMMDFRKKSLGIGDRIQVMMSDQIFSPMIVGFVRPTLYIPAKKYTSRELALILHHELIHYKRNDLWYKFLMILVRTIYWYNPIVYLMVREAEKDVEYICDERVTEGLNRKSRMIYNRLLLSTVQKRQSCPLLFSTNFNGGVSSFKKRIVNIMYMKRRRSGSVLAVLCCLSVIGGSILVGCSVKTESATVSKDNDTDTVSTMKIEQDKGPKEEHQKGRWKGEEYYDVQGNLVDDDAQYEYEVTQDGSYLMYYNRIYGFSFKVPADWEQSVISQNNVSENYRELVFTDRINREANFGGRLFTINVWEMEEGWPSNIGGKALYHFTFNGKSKWLIQSEPSDVQYEQGREKTRTSYENKRSKMSEVLASVVFDINNLGDDNVVTDIQPAAEYLKQPISGEESASSEIREINDYLTQRPEVMAEELGLKDAQSAGGYTCEWISPEVFAASIAGSCMTIDYVLVQPKSALSLYGVQCGMGSDAAEASLGKEGWEMIYRGNGQRGYQDEDGNRILLRMTGDRNVEQIVWSSKANVEYGHELLW